jgi:hypothetical protein
MYGIKTKTFLSFLGTRITRFLVKIKNHSRTTMVITIVR